MDPIIFVRIADFIIALIVVIAVTRLFTIASLLRQVLEELRILNNRENVTRQEEIRKKYRGVYVEGASQK